MKFAFGSSLLLSMLSAAVALEFGTPAAQTTLSEGSDFTVQVIDNESGEDYSQVIIGLYSGTTLPIENIGTVLYEGSYTPTGTPPSQDITVTVPEGFTAGTALLSVAPQSKLPRSPLVDVTSIEVEITA